METPKTNLEDVVLTEYLCAASELPSWTLIRSADCVRSFSES